MGLSSHEVGHSKCALKHKKGMGATQGVLLFDTALGEKAAEIFPSAGNAHFP